jgi:hypothetical protein
MQPSGLIPEDASQNTAQIVRDLRRTEASQPPFAEGGSFGRETVLAESNKWRKIVEDLVERERGRGSIVTEQPS